MSLPTANIIQGRYRYTSDLLKLSITSSPSPYCTWPMYQFPIKLDELTPFLTRHPDQALASYIHMGLLTGFRIGYSHNHAHLHSRNINHPSALANKKVVDERIAAELAAGQLLGPVSPPLTPLVHTSPLGLVPKVHQPNKWCVICDLSSPFGSSVNDSIQFSGPMLPALCQSGRCSPHRQGNTTGQTGPQRCL